MASALVTVLVLLLGRAHSIASAHVWCAEHGNWAHAEHLPSHAQSHSSEPRAACDHDARGDDARGDAAPGDDREPHGEDDPHGEHEHCPWQELCGFAFASFPCGPALDVCLTTPTERVARPLQTPRAPPISLVLLAPKQSPPV